MDGLLFIVALLIVDYYCSGRCNNLSDKNNLDDKKYYSGKALHVLCTNYAYDTVSIFHTVPAAGTSTWYWYQVP